MDEFGLPALGLTASGDYRARGADPRRGAGDRRRRRPQRPRAASRSPGRASTCAPAARCRCRSPTRSSPSARRRWRARCGSTPRAQGALTAPRLGGTLSLAGGTLVYPEPQHPPERHRLRGEPRGQRRRVCAASAPRSRPAARSPARAGSRSTRAGYPGRPQRCGSTTCATPTAQFVSTRLNGGLTMTGPLVGGGGLLAGTIDLGRTEISIAEGLGAVAGGARAGGRTSPRRRRCRSPSTAPGSARRRRGPGRAGPGIGLDVRINAPNQIFVRGRGLDVELGGALRIQGTTTDIQPVGQFDLRRGRLLVLGQRIDFDEGSLQLVGNLDPQIHFVAETQSAGRHRDRHRRRPGLGAADHLLLRAAAAAGRGAGAGAVQPRDRRISRPSRSPSSPPPRPSSPAAAARASCRSCAAPPGSTTSTSSPRRTARPRSAPASTSTTTSTSTCRPTPTASRRAEIRPRPQPTTSPPAARSARTATRRSGCSTSATSDSRGESVGIAVDPAARRAATVPDAIQSAIRGNHMHPLRARPDGRPRRDSRCRPPPTR